MSAINPINLDNNHEQDDNVERQQLRAQVKKKATDDLTSRPSKSMRNELHKFADQLMGSGVTCPVLVSFTCKCNKKPCN